MRTLKHLLMAGSAIGLALVMAERAAAADAPSLAQAGAEDWMLGGSTEFGGQVFLTKPGAPLVTPTWNANGTINVPAQGNSAAGYNTYGTQTDPLFMKSLEFDFAKKDGSLTGELLGANIGENNQKLELDAESPGQWMVDFAWDQTDHLRSNTAQTLYTNAGSTNLVMPNSVVQGIYNAAFPYGIEGSSSTTGTSGGGETQPSVNGPAGPYSGANPWTNVINGLQNLTGTGSGITKTYAPTTGAGAYAFAGQPYGCYIPPQKGATQTNSQGTVICGASGTITPMATTILNNENVINLGVHRDKKEAGATWDVAPNFDIKVDYSNEHRTGLQEQGVVFGSSPSAGVMEVPMPIDDTTQDASVTASGFGKTAWGGKWNAVVKYDASLYTDAFSSFQAENPFGGPNNTAGAGTNCFVASTAAANCNGTAQFGTAPDNQANTVMVQGGVDLPGFKSNRYMGTLEATQMTQNEAFIPMSVNPVNTPVTTVVGSGSVNYNPLPRNSLDGQIDTILSNNVLNTEITADWRNKATYRYYSYQNDTPAFDMGAWILNDALTGAYNNHDALFQSYIKQNASDEMTYRLGSLGSVGVFGGLENYQYNMYAANITNEWTGKVFGQFTPTDSITVRFDDLYAQRRYQEYNWTNLDGIIAGGTTYGPGTGNPENPYMVDMDLANRNRNKGDLYVDMQLPGGVTITPTAGYRWDDYPADAAILAAANAASSSTIGNVGQLGLQYDHSYNLGIEGDWAINSAVSLNLSYTFEHSEQELLGSTSGSADNLAYNSLMTEDVHTLMAGAKFAVIPDRLTLKLSGTYEFAADNWNTNPAGQCSTYSSSAANCSVGGAVNPGNPLYPTEFDHYAHVDAAVLYKFDPLMFGSTKMDAVLSLKYTYEQNAVTNWQTDDVAPYMYSTLNSSTTAYKNIIFMAGDNPNYSAQAVMASLSLKW